MVKMEDLGGLAEFLETARTESFSRAAENLKVSVAHVSRSVSATEKRLALSLFTRTTRKVKLTEAGRSFYSQCLPLLEELSQIQKQARDAPADLAGKIRVSVAGRFAERTLTPLIARFCRLHPQVVCEIDFSSRHIDLLGESFDFAVRAGQLGDSSFLVAKKIRTFPFVTLAGTRLAAALKGSKSPTQVDPKLCLSHWGRDWKFRRRDELLSFKPQGPLDTNNAEALVAAALEGIGVIQVPAYYGVEALAAGELVSLWPDWQEPDGITFSFVYPIQGFQPRRVRALMDFIYEAIGR